jgi:hypothetical protein
MNNTAGIWVLLLAVAAIQPAEAEAAPAPLPARERQKGQGTPEQRINALLARLRATGEVTVTVAQWSGKLWAKEVRGQTLTGVVFKRYNNTGQVDLVIHARTCHFVVTTKDGKLTLRLEEGVGTTDDGSRAYFEERELTLYWPSGTGKDSPGGK